MSELEELVDILDKHVQRPHTPGDNGWYVCLCDEATTYPHQRAFNLHIAAALTARDTRIREDAWDEGVKAAGGYGHEDGWTHDINPYLDNPYRKESSDD